MCVGNMANICSNNGLSPVWRQVSIWTNGILSTGPLGTNFSEFLIEIEKKIIQENAFENVVSEMVAIFCLPQRVLNTEYMHIVLFLVALLSLLFD